MERFFWSHIAHYTVYLWVIKWIVLVHDHKVSHLTDVVLYMFLSFPVFLKYFFHSVIPALFIRSLIVDCGGHIMEYGEIETGIMEWSDLCNPVQIVFRNICKHKNGTKNIYAKLSRKKKFQWFLENPESKF